MIDGVRVRCPTIERFPSRKYPWFRPSRSLLRETADERGVYNAIGFLCQLIFLTPEIFLSDFFLQANRSGIRDDG